MTSYHIVPAGTGEVEVEVTDDGEAARAVTPRFETEAEGNLQF